MTKDNVTVHLSTPLESGLDAARLPSTQCVYGSRCINDSCAEHIAEFMINLGPRAGQHDRLSASERPESYAYSKLVTSSDGMQIQG